MKKTRMRFKSELKAQVALAAVQERETLSEISKRFKIHPVQITKWKQEFLRNASAAFEKGVADQDLEAEKQKLYAKIGAVGSGARLAKKNFKAIGATNQLRAMIKKDKKLRMGSGASESVAKIGNLLSWYLIGGQTVSIAFGAKPRCSPCPT